jgi:hypothetical protein
MIDTTGFYQPALKCYAVNNGSGLTGCGAKGKTEEHACRFRQLNKNDRCMHVKFEEYCDCIQAQLHAKGHAV